MILGGSSWALWASWAPSDSRTAAASGSMCGATGDSIASDHHVQTSLARAGGCVGFEDVTVGLVDGSGPGYPKAVAGNLSDATTGYEEAQCVQQWTVLDMFDGALCCDGCIVDNAGGRWAWSRRSRVGI